MEVPRWWENPKLETEVRKEIGWNVLVALTRRGISAEKTTELVKKILERLKSLEQ